MFYLYQTIVRQKFMQKHQLIVPKTARYFTLGELNENTENVYFVIHGYGQLAEFFIKKFKVLDDGKTFIVAPEALSRFYLNGFNGRVGATWMTREERESEISDYINYLNLLYDTVLSKNKNKSLKVNILGFSQGTATVARWCMNEHIRYDRLILWAGYFGNGIRDVINPEKVLNKEVILCYGKQDEFLKQIDIQQYEQDVRATIPHIQIHTFEGGHTIEEADLLFIADDSMFDVRVK
jgi:predicted esterase